MVIPYVNYSGKAVGFLLLHCPLHAASSMCYPFFFFFSSVLWDSLGDDKKGC